MVSAAQTETATATVVEVKKDTTVNIPVHFLRQGYRTPVLRLVERLTTNRFPGQLVVYTSVGMNAVRGTSSSAMGVKNVINPIWKKYVTEYLSYVVIKWYTPVSYTHLTLPTICSV